MQMMNSMRLNRNSIWIAGLLFVLGLQSFMANPKSADPAAEFSSLKAKYPDDVIVSVLQKRDIVIVPGEDSVPFFRVRDTGVDMILSENGADISEAKEYFNGKTEVRKFEAYSLVPEQRKYKRIEVPKFDKSAEFDDDLYYDDTYCYAFNFPGTGKGVKRCTYSEMDIKDPYYPLTFFFGRNIPVDNAELTVTVPENIRISYHLFGADTSSVRFKTERKGKMITYKWTSHQPKAYERDFMAPGMRYLRPHLILHLASCLNGTDTVHYMGTLDDLYAWMNGKIGWINSTISPDVKEMADSVTRGIPGTTEKIRAIYKWVQNNIKYIAIEDGDHGFVPREASLVLKRRYGDCKDKASLLSAMICSVGEKASLASVGTRELPYKYSEFPSVACSNHMITVWWDKGKPVILDGTTHYNKMEDVPAYIQGKECIIAKEDGKFQLYKIPVAGPESNAQFDSIHLSIDKELLRGKGSTTIYGEYKMIIAAKLDRKEEHDQMTFWPKVISGVSDKLTVTGLKMSDINQVNNPIKSDFSFQLPDYLIRQGTRIYLNMNIERELDQLRVKEDRSLPVENEFEREHRIIYELRIPENMQVDFLPAPVVYNNPLFGFSQSYKKTDHDVYMESRIHLNTLLIEGKDISDFREMLSVMQRAYRQTVILSVK